jgi:hypothetical protein
MEILDPLEHHHLPLVSLSLVDLVERLELEIPEQQETVEQEEMVVAAASAQK